LKHPGLAYLLLSILWASSACSRSEAPDDEHGVSAFATTKGDDAAISGVRAAAHALAQPEPTVDFIASEMEGVIMARTKSQALMHFDGYRVTLTTPADQVTRITFELVEARPSVRQLTEAFGTPRQVRKGMLYEHESAATGSTLLILAEPVSMPPGEDTLVRRIVVEGAPTR
jgi:hypothetical protein